jgi:hypothetical protein
MPNSPQNPESQSLIIFWQTLFKVATFEPTPHFFHGFQWLPTFQVQWIQCTFFTVIWPILDTTNHKLHILIVSWAWHGMVRLSSNLELRIFHVHQAALNQLWATQHESTLITIKSIWNNLLVPKEISIWHLDSRGGPGRPWGSARGK